MIPAWAMTILIKVVLPLLIQELVKSGVISQLEADGIEDLGGLVKVLKGVKFYSAPSDFPNPPPETVAPNNLNKES